MQSEFLIKVIERSSHAPDGCGMSCRPSFYSGRGATSSDLSDKSLEVIYQAIKTNVSETAADEYAKMVRDIPVLSATDFLITLEAFEANNWVWDTSLLSTAGGKQVECIGTAFATAMGSWGGRVPRDETAGIRFHFLRRHNLTETREDPVLIMYYGR